MATLKTANGKGKYRDLDAKGDLINYILNPYKTPHNLTGGAGVDPNNIAYSMSEISANFGKENGVQLRHFILSFSPYELCDLEIAEQIARDVVHYFLREYQTVYSVHEDTDHLHIHIVINSVSHVDGHRYYGTKREFHSFMAYLKKVLFKYGINRLTYVSNKTIDENITAGFYS